jgi:hypothetical protein
MNELDKEEKLERVVRYTIFYGYEGSQAVPARPSGKGKLKRKQGVPKLKGREMINEARREVKQDHTALAHNFEF